MKRFFESLFARLDSHTETMTRNVAQNHGRRSFLTHAGAVLLGTAVLPILPFYRNSGMAHAEETAEDPNDPHSCEYWRYCAMDGNMCNECGGTFTSCPAGSETSAVSWVGTCLNPVDGKDYLVSYNDCCGRAMCNGTTCLNSHKERPGYRMGLHNDINWCMANTSKGYHCTLAILVGIADA